MSVNQPSRHRLAYIAKPDEAYPLLPHL